jgi:peptidoglycan hydrolase CwlO-like protein
MSSTQSKIDEHIAVKEKLYKEIAKINAEIAGLKSSIQEGLEKVLDEKIIIKDDLKENIEGPEIENI